MLNWSNLKTSHQGRLDCCVRMFADSRQGKILSPRGVFLKCDKSMAFHYCKYVFHCLSLGARIAIDGLRRRNCQSDRLSSVGPWVQFSRGLQTTVSHVTRVSQHSADSRGFSLGSPVSSLRES